MKPKNPILAAVLNIVIPGLGCAYAGSWFYALIFLIWVPLAYLAAFFVASAIASLFIKSLLRDIVFILLMALFCFRILFEQTSMPYRMIKENNLKSVQNI